MTYNNVTVSQVHVRHRPCFGRTNTVTCNCAVAFRENNNVLGVFACRRGKAPVAVRYLTDPLAPADDITLSRDGIQYTVIEYARLQRKTVCMNDVHVAANT